MSTAEPANPLPVVFVHGIGVASPYFAPTITRLAPDFRGYAPDLPGFGESDKPAETLDVPALADFLGAWLDAAGLDRIALVGNSFGCQIAVELAARHADPLTHLALLGPTMDRAARTPLRQTLRWLANGVHERPTQLPLLVRDYRAAGLRRPYETFRLALEHRVEEQLPHVTVPTLVVRGARDRIVPQRWAEEVTNLLPQGRLAVIPKRAHTLNFNAPDEVARLLRAFLL